MPYLKASWKFVFVVVVLFNIFSCVLLYNIYLLLLRWCRSVNTIIALCTAVEKNFHQLQAWDSVFSFAHFMYLNNPTDVRESHTFKGSSDLACVLGVLWELGVFMFCNVQQ